MVCVCDVLGTPSVQFADRAALLLCCWHAGHTSD